MLELVEKDLLSKKPHPFASYIWTQIHIAMGDDRVAFEEVKNNEKISNALGNIVHLVNSHQCIESYEGWDKYSVEYISTSNKPAELWMILQNTTNTQKRIEIIKRALQICPGINYIYSLLNETELSAVILTST